MRNPEKLNKSGCKDLTPYEALKNIESEERVKKLMKAIYLICDLAGFRIAERIIVQDKKTGKVWR